MSDLLSFSLVGASTGALIALSALGIVLVYRGSGILNFANGAIGSVGVFVYWFLQSRLDVPPVVAATAGIAASALLGFLAYQLVARPMRDASPLAKIVANLALTALIFAALTLIFGSDQRIAFSFLPQGTLTIGGLLLGVDRMILFAGALVFTVTLGVVYRRTVFGLATTASAENQLATQALGYSPDRIAAMNWTIGSAISGLAGILLAPYMGVQVQAQIIMLLPAIAAALLGGLRSFPLMFVGGILIGVLQANATRFVELSGIAMAVPFIVIMLVLLIKSPEIIIRTSLQERRPRVGTGQIPIGYLVVAVAISAGLMWFVFSDSFVYAAIVTIATAIILLSSVVVTGYAGLLSLAQFTFAGLAGLVAVRIADSWGWPFWIALPVGALLMVPLGALIALPSVRVRGVSLAVVTFAVAATVQAMVFNNGFFTKNDTISVPNFSFFGLEMDAFLYPQRYATFGLVLLVLVSLMVANLRRSTTGRRLVALRANERAAQSVGINLLRTKAYAFGLGSAIAGIGGVYMIWSQTTAVFIDTFEPFDSINGLVYGVLGGVGMLVGPVIGGLGARGGVATTLFHGGGANVHLWIAVIGGILTILTLQKAPDGAAGMMAHQWEFIRKHLHLPKPKNRAREEVPVAGAEFTRVPPMDLAAKGLTVRYGRVVALNNVDVELRPGEILGVIGANGAGKTTLIEVVTGYTRPSQGTVSLRGTDISGLPAHLRVQSGLGRSFQSVELFDDLTVAENLRVAAERPGRWSSFTDLFRPRRDPLPSEVWAILEELDLGRSLDALPTDLSYGRRRLVGIARSLAARPSVLCLDEPAAGLNSVESAELARVITTIAKKWGVAVLLVEHDLELVMSVSDRLLAMEFGAVIAEGDPVAVRNDRRVVASYLGVEEDAEAAL